MGAASVERTARVLELLDDPQRTYRVVHVTGTNGKTSTSRIIESLLRAHGLRTGLFTSPHLERFTERIMVDGEPIADAAVAEAWEEIEPFVDLVDAELAAAGDAALTFFELLTVLAFVAFADAPVDVAVIEVGMGGAWDSTNTADGDVAVIAPIGIDHADRLGSTIREIAQVKSGIIKDGAAVVSARQVPEAEAVLREAAARRGASIAFEGEDFALTDQVLAVGGQHSRCAALRGRPTRSSTCPSTARIRRETRRSAIAAVEALIGGGTQPIASDVLAEGLGAATSPGRLQLIGIDPTVVVDAAHNPHGARALAAALRETFDFREWGVVLGPRRQGRRGHRRGARPGRGARLRHRARLGSGRIGRRDRRPPRGRGGARDDAPRPRGRRGSSPEWASAARDAPSRSPDRSSSRARRSSWRARRTGPTGADPRDHGVAVVSAESTHARPPRRVRRPRGAQESLGSVVLGFESIIVFLGGLVVYGLRALPGGIEPWWGIVGAPSWPLS